LKPWRVKSWCIGKPSAQYVAKMEDVLAVYARPYDPKRPVVCLDEASKELHSTPRGSLPMLPGQPQRQDYEYERHGVCNLFMALEPLTGRRKVRVTERRTAQDFAEELRTLIDEDQPAADVVVLVTDNLNTHGPACLYQRFEPAEARRIAAKIEWHYTPEHGSWLNCQIAVVGDHLFAPHRVPFGRAAGRHWPPLPDRNRVAFVKMIGVGMLSWLLAIGAS